MKCHSEIGLRCHLLQRHPHRQDCPLHGLRLRHRARSRRGSAPIHAGDVPSRAVGCLEEQSELSCLLIDRGRLPSPPHFGGLDRLSLALRYYATVRLLSSLGHVVLSFSMATAAVSRAEAERPHWVRTQTFLPSPSPVRPWIRRTSGFASWRKLTLHGCLVGASLVFGSVFHHQLPPDVPSRGRPCLRCEVPCVRPSEDFHLLFCVHASRDPKSLAQGETHCVDRRISRAWAALWRGPTL